MEGSEKKTYQNDKPVIDQVKACKSIANAVLILAEAIDSLLKNDANEV